MILCESEILAASILIVDDQETNVLLLEQLLHEAGYSQVSSTRDPTEVCTLHRRNRFDLILLDLQMPRMDGFQVMAGLSTDISESYLPVIVLTAQPGHKLRALQAGAKDFVSKPFDLIEVKTRIHNMLEVRLLYRKLEAHQSVLEQLVEERTAQLRESEARYRSLTELASDWYWEQDDEGHFTRVSGPVLEMLGISVEPLVGEPRADDSGWDKAERSHLRATIEARQPFLDFVFSRTHADGSRQRYRVSGEPMFSKACRYLGYRGIGVEIFDSDPVHAWQPPARCPAAGRVRASSPASGADRIASGTSDLCARRTVAACPLSHHLHPLPALCTGFRDILRSGRSGQRGHGRHRTDHGRRHHFQFVHGANCRPGLAAGPIPAQAGVSARRHRAAVAAALHPVP